MKRYYSLVREDPIWSKVIGFSIILLFIRLADAIVSFWAPNLIQDSLSDPVSMGLVISFQSIVGFGADLVFPNLLKTATVKKLIIFAIFMSALTTVSLFITSLKPITVFFLISMTLWGIYYELETFGTYQFVGNVVPLEKHSGAWGIMGVFKNLAYFLGPLVGAWLLIRGNITTAVVTISILILALIIFVLKSKMQDRPLEPDISHINPLSEMKHWFTLFEHVWPIILITLLMGFIDSTFWTTGAVWTEKLARQDPLGSLFLPFYQLPALFVGFIVVRWGIYKGKKKWAERFLLVAGFFLVLLIISSSIPWQLAMVLASSLALAVSYPLLDGVYSDIMARLGKEKKHMIGFTSSMVNVAYVVWPPIAGILTRASGERMTFVYMGIATIIVAVFLLIVTPRKLKLPQTEISTWKD